MPFLAEVHHPIPTKDILSWYFDDPTFDQDRPVYIDAEDTSKFWTANQCRKGIRQIAAGFRALGLKAGDTVCIHSFNSLDYPILVNGINGFGGVYTGANPAYTPYEIAHHLRASEAKAVVVEPELLPTLLKAAEEIQLPSERILIFNSDNQEIPDGFRSWETLFEHGEMDWPKFDDLKTAQNTIAALLFSSGTTGLPKAVMLSHYNLVAQQTLFCEWRPTPWQCRRLMVLPMFHAATAPICHYAPLHIGDAIFTMRRFELISYLQHVEKLQITEGAFVPPMVHMINASPYMKKNPDALKSIRRGVTGAAPLDAASQFRLKKFLRDDCTLTQVWGMTETSCSCAMTPWDDPAAHATTSNQATPSVGKMLPNMDAKLVDDDGNDISKDDTPGELCVRGPLVVNGYFKNPEANARDWDNEGFFHTGDVAVRDGQTKTWHIVNRKKELIKVRGFQVAPIELEGVILTHPDIVDAAVLGVPAQEEKDGELPRAYLVRRPGSSPTVESVKEHMTERLAKYKQCIGGIVFVEQIPKTASGKILKRLLKEQATKEMEEEGKGKVRARM